MLKNLERLLGKHPGVWDNPPRWQLIREVIARWEALVAESGALATCGVRGQILYYGEKLAKIWLP